MTARSESIQIDIDDEQMSGTFLSPKSKVPGVLFVHGWGGSQERDLERAKGIAGLGCVCLTFDLRGHTNGTGIPLTRVTREDNLRDLLAAYDRLLAHPASIPRRLPWSAPVTGVSGLDPDLAQAGSLAGVAGAGAVSRRAMARAETRSGQAGPA